MLSPKTRWSAKSADPALVRELSDRLRIRPLLAALLAVRGYSVEEAEFFLYGSPEFHDPFLLDGMQVAVERIQAAIAERRKIRIYGDYDADGVSSVSLLVRLFRQLGAEFDYMIPHRVIDGYGLHTAALERAKRDGVSLMVTVDTGITAVQEAEVANELGLELIITDHHEPPSILPAATCVVNPKKPACGYPFKGLAGVGVAFKLAQGLLGRVPEELAEWAALGTIADVMPLVGENRSIVKLGIERLRRSPSIGFAALFKMAGVEARAVNSGTIGFGLAPRINASGRLDRADDAVRLLITEDEREAEVLARRLDDLNKERQALVEQTAAEAKAMVESAGGPGDAIVVASEGWNPGVIGIAAARLVEQYRVPVVVIAMDKETGMGKGSARAIDGFHLYDALKACEGALVQFGGHESAAGLSIEQVNVDRFTELFCQEAAARITPEMKIPATEADLEVEFADLSVENIEELERLAPFGPEHPAPKFIIKSAEVQSIAMIGKDRRHAKIRLANEANEVDVLGFGMAEEAAFIAEGSKLSAVGELSINEWNGKRTAQMIVKDFSVPHMQLFDLRGIAAAAAIKRRAAQAWTERNLPAFLLGAYDDPPPELSAWWGKIPAYRMGGLDQAGSELYPMNDAARNTSFGDVTDLFLAACPFPYPRLRRIINLGSSLERIYALQTPQSIAGRRLADRDLFKLVYRVLSDVGETAEADLFRLLAGQHGIGPGAVRFALEVFAELELVIQAERNGCWAISPSPRKRELTESLIFKEEEQAENARREWESSGPLSELQRCVFGAANDTNEGLHPITEAMA